MKGVAEGRKCDQVSCKLTVPGSVLLRGVQTRENPSWLDSMVRQYDCTSLLDTPDWSELLHMGEVQDEGCLLCP